MREAEVLIVGGGPVGLTASILLSRLGVRSLLVERHPGTSIHPKARGINVRTMEIFRQCGVEAAVRAAGLAARAVALHHLGRARWPARSSSGACRRARGARGPPGEPGAPLPLRPGRSRAGAARPRRVARPRRAALRHRADGLRRGRRRVTATLRGAGGERAVRARYLIAADGARSRVREALGIAMHGTPGPLPQRQRAAARRPDAVDRGPAGRALLHRAAGAQGDVPDDQRPEPLGLPRQQPARQRRRATSTRRSAARRSCARRPACPTCPSRSSARCRGWRRPRSPSATAAAAPSWPATRPTTCRPRAASG